MSSLYRMVRASLGVAILTVPATGVTPVEKVITLLEEMRNEVMSEGRDEATAYDDFACFCRDTTSTKSDAITSGKTNIDTLSTSIAEDTASLQMSSTELRERKAKQEKLAADKAAKEAECEDAETAYRAEAAKLSKAISSLSNAIQSLEASKPAAAVLAQLKESADSSPAVAAAVSLLEKGTSSLRRVDPINPEYKFFSQPIINTLNKLHVEFTGKKTELDGDWTQTNANCNNTILDYSGRMGNNSEAMTNLGTTLETLKGDVSDNREALVLAESALKDDKVYLKDLTERCEKRAKDWDQRSQMRADELTALNKSLEIIENRVSTLDSEVNARALLLQGKQSNGAAAAASSVKLRKQGLSFLQELSINSKIVVVRNHADAAAQARAVKVAQLLHKEGMRLRSTALVALAMDLKADPFGRVKELIQQLIERLLAQSTSEAKKEHYCREQMALAKQERDYRLSDALKMNAQLAKMNATRDELEAEIEELDADIESLNDALNKSTEQRETEHDLNMEAIDKAKKGIEAVTEAIVLLKTFYKQASSAMLQSKASPLDEELRADPGFEGSYKGKQEGAKGVIGMLEVIKTDFQRTVDKTTAAEKDAAASYVEFERTSKTDVSGKETKMVLNQEDLDTIRIKIERGLVDMQNHVDLMDNAVKKLEVLKPMCIDNKMSFEERKAKRQDEIDALKRALCILDTHNVEEECAGSAPAGEPE